tara:strand:+ start:195 stop:422 length:228 start_codon:yes stop_codon:yes gene_type:complete
MAGEFEELNDCYQDLFEKVIELQEKYPSPMIAGSMVAQALRIYKTTLNDEEFESMIDAIAESQSKIEPFDRPTLQ